MKKEIRKIINLESSIYFMKNEIRKTIEFASSCKHTQDFRSPDYISDGEMIDEIIEKLKQLKNKV